MRSFLAFAEFESLWQALTPETPYGRDEKNKLIIYYDQPSMEKVWDQTELAGRLLEDLAPDPLRLSRLTHHLKRLPRFPDEARPSYGEVELFEVKKFVHNYTEILGLLPPEIRYGFVLPAAPGGLLALLDRGRQSAESFHLADAYSPRLAEIRNRLRELESALDQVRALRAQAIQESFGLAFGDRPFLVVEGARFPDLGQAQGLLQLEPYDEGRVLARALPGPGEWALLEEREGLLAQERIEEGVVLQRLGEALREALPGLRACRDAVTTFDLALARARLAQDRHLVRPQLGSALRVEGGRFLPCEALCARLGVAYTPLDAEFSSAATVIFGSNMGGKTVVLKTLAFLQACVQTGLFVPALGFQTRPFRHLHFIGEGEGQGCQGLSGFGREIHQVVEALSDREGGCLLLFDEFARTTSSREAEALLSALLEWVARQPGCFTLCSTHFRGLPRPESVDFRRMAGLRAGDLQLASAEGVDLEARIRLIDRHMDYHLVEDTGDAAVSDALTIAALLGLDPQIAARARALLEFRRDRGEGL